MSYTILHADGQSSIVVDDGVVDTTSTSLSLVGKNAKGYAKPISENFLHLLENFASPTPPQSPVTGQLWYDTSGTPQLNIWDGSLWVSPTSLFKSATAPTTAQLGDLWMDTVKQQLFFFSSTDWILVGPQFSSGLQTGPVAKTLIDINNAEHNVIEMIVSVTETDQTVTQQRIAIISFSEFVPKSLIPGFSVIRPGINMSSEVSGAIWGTSENSLKLNGVAASEYLKRDVQNTVTKKFIVSSNNGISVGVAGNVKVTNDSQNNAIISNSHSGKAIVLRTTSGNLQTDTLTVSQLGSVLLSPLEVQGTMSANNGTTVKYNNTTVMAIGNTISINADTAVNATLSSSEVNSDSILPTSSNGVLGNNVKKWSSITVGTVNADDIIISGTISGTVSGNITGTAAGLTTPTPIRFSGDFAETSPILFSGTGAPLTISISATPDLFNNRGPVDNSSMMFDEILINRANVGLRRITKSTFVSDLPVIPVGGVIIYPDIGTLPPGFVKCDGTEYQRLALPVLFNKIGTHYGSTSSTTFKVANYTAVGGSIYIMYTGQI